MATNPMLNESAFERARENARNAYQVMTMQGTINKTFALLFICVLGGMISWTNYQSWAAFLWPVAIAGFIAAIVTSFKPNFAPFTAPVYAFLEGLFLARFPPPITRSLKALFLTPSPPRCWCFSSCCLCTAQGLLRCRAG